MVGQTTTKWFKLAIMSFFKHARKIKKFLCNNRFLKKHLAFQYLNTILNHFLKNSDEHSADFHGLTCIYIYTSGYTNMKDGFSYISCKLYKLLIVKVSLESTRIDNSRGTVISWITWRRMTKVISSNHLKLQDTNPTISNCRLRNSQQNGLSEIQATGREWSKKILQ